MIRLRLCQKLPLKLNCVRASSLSAASALPIESPSASNNPPISRTHSRCKSNTDPKQQNPELCEKPHSFDGYFFPQSITLFRFDNLPNHDEQTGTTRVQVLEQWKQLLENLKTIVENFSCTRTAVQDVSAIRVALEQHHLLKLLVKPYSYAAEDVQNSVSQQSSHVMLDPLQDIETGSAGRKKKNEVTKESVIDRVNVFHVGASSRNTHLDFHQQSCINRLEQESLRAVMVLTAGAWKYPVENSTALSKGLISCVAQPAETSPVMLCQAGETGNEGKKPTGSKGQGRPNRDQLFAVQDYMADNLPKIFVKFHSYDIYTNDVVFENNWYIDKSYVTVGTLSYALEIAKLRLFVHLRYANVKMQLLKITTHEEDGTVRVRWRISGLPQTKAIMFWKFLPWANRFSTAEDSEWLDGFSTFFVDDTGLIYKHKMDRVMPDEGPEVKKNQTVIEKIANKIATPVATYG